LIAWIKVLEALHRCDGQITDYGNRAGQILFDPAIGVGERIERETFSLLCEKGCITTEDQGRIRRYRISEAGMTRLIEIEMQHNEIGAQHKAFAARLS
jgi:hypothetical protein